MKLVLTIIYLICTTSGIIFMKLGGDSLKLSIAGGLSFKLGYITLVGFCFYIASFLIWQQLVVSFNLSYIVPITTGIVQVLCLIAGAIIFKEQINIYNIAGVVLIIIGIILVAYKKVN